MQRLAGTIAVFVLAACPKGSGTGPAQPGAGCPAGSGVFVASYVAQEPAKGRSGWVVPLHAAAITPGDNVAPYASIDAAAAAAAGVPAAPTGSLWLVTATGEPCHATVGRYYATRIDTQMPSVSYGIEIEGCPAPANPQDGGGVVLVSEAPPTGCHFEGPQPVAARLGDMTPQKQWQPPATSTPIPPALASVIPQQTCTAPACEMLWAFGEVKVNDQTVAWSGAVNWLAVGDPATPCTWQAQRFSGFFVPGPGGAAIKVTEGQEHPLVLSAVLADGGGARVLLAEGPGEYATYDFVAGAAPRLARHAPWMIAPPEAWEAVDHLGPVCDTPAPR